jgi:hypothetical protein
VCLARARLAQGKMGKAIQVLTAALNQGVPSVLRFMATSAMPMRGLAAAMRRTYR